MCLFFKQSEPMAAVWGQNKVVGIVKKCKACCRTLCGRTRRVKNFGRTKRQRVLKGFSDRGSGWNTVRQQVLYFAEFVINVLNKYSTLFKTVFILLQHFLLPRYSIK